MGIIATLVIAGMLVAIAWLAIQRIVQALVRLLKIALGAVYAAAIAGMAATLTGHDVLLPAFVGFLTGVWFTCWMTTPRPVQASTKPPATAVREPKADAAVAKAWEKALASAPHEATAILKARTPCALLLARSASNDLDFPTIEVVQIIRRHVPELVAGHCGVIATLDPARRPAAIAEMINDLHTIATMAQSRLDLIAARRREGIAVQRSHLERRAGTMVAA